MDCYSDFKSLLMEVNFQSTPESTVVKALKYSTPSLNFCLIHMVQWINVPAAFRQLLCHAVTFKKLFKPLSILLLEHLLLFSQLLDAKVILFGFGHFFNLTSSKKKKEKKRQRCAGFIYLAIIILYRAVLLDENVNHAITRK